MDRVALQILEDGWEQDARAMRRAAAVLRERLGEPTRDLPSREFDPGRGRQVMIPLYR